MTPELLASIAGVVLSLAFSYVPGLNVKFALFEPTVKRLIMAGLIVLVGAAAYGLSCVGWWATVTCDKAGIESLIGAVIAALIASQATYMLSPTSPAIDAERVRLSLRDAHGRG
jgi:phage-related protein